MPRGRRGHAEAVAEAKRRKEEEERSRQRQRIQRQAAAARKRVDRSKEVAASSKKTKEATAKPLPQHELASKSTKPKRDFEPTRIKWVRDPETGKKEPRPAKPPPRSARPLTGVEKEHVETYKDAKPKELLGRLGFQEASKQLINRGRAEIEQQAATVKAQREAGIHQEARPAPKAPSWLDDAAGVIDLLTPSDSGVQMAGIPMPKIVGRLGRVWGESAVNAVRDPLRVGGQVPDFLLGVTRGFGALSQAPQESGAVLGLMAGGLRENLRTRYGADAEVRGHEAENLIDAAFAGAAGLRAAQTAKAMAAGATFREARRFNDLFPDLIKVPAS